MTIASISMLRPKPPPFLFPASLIQQRFISAAARPHSNSINVRKHHQQQQPHKNLLKARETFKNQFSSLSPLLSHEDCPQLNGDQAVGTVAAAQANFMRVVVNSDSRPEGDFGRLGVELLCVVKAVLKKIKRRVLVGDNVLVGAIDWVDRRGMIQNVFQRKSEVRDPPVANVDHLLVIFSFEQPKIEAFTLTRFLIEAESSGIPFTLALNKAELVQSVTLAEWKSRLRGWGYEPVICSVDTKLGLDTLESRLRDQMTVIVGPSGVGKSSLINALRDNASRSVLEDDNWFEPIRGSKWFEEQRVGEVSARSGKGKHVTRNVSLLPLSGGGYLADTPGFNQPSLSRVTKHSLARYFPEIQKMREDSEAGKCSFSDCLHVGEPGCIVKGDWERYTFYLQFLDEIKIREEFQLRTFGTKRESDVRLKVGEFGVKIAEPRLQHKKYRRQSRRSKNQSKLYELYDDDDDDDEISDSENPILGAVREENQ